MVQRPLLRVRLLAGFCLVLIVAGWYTAPAPLRSGALLIDAESVASTFTTGTWDASATGTYVFMGTNAWTAGADCPASQKKRDMQIGYVPFGPEETHTRTSGTGTASFCAQPVSGATTLTAGTTTVRAWFGNTHGSTCNITATLQANGAAVGSGTITIPNQTPKTLYAWSFATAGAALSAGDQIALRLVWQSVKACDQTDLYWNGPGSDSRVEVP